MTEEAFVTQQKEYRYMTLTKAIYPTNKNFNYGGFAIYFEILLISLAFMFYYLIKHN